MKRFNNIIVFVAVVLIIACGFSQNYFEVAQRSLNEFSAQIEAGNVIGGAENFTATFETQSSEELKYHNWLMDINSLKDNLLGTAIIKKDSDTVVKSKGGSLVDVQEKIEEAELDAIVKSIDGLYKNTKESGAKFLYIAAPTKGYGFQLPENVKDYKKENLDLFLEKMNAAQIPTLDLTQKMMDEGIYGEDAFFITDHHWTIKSAFWANGQVCKELNRLYGFSFNPRNTDLSNYKVDTYKDYFLGSYGKKTGRFFVDGGAEDIDIITPKFETDFIESQPFKKTTRKGDFTQTVMYKTHISEKDYYGKNPYAAYSGGDFRLQIIKNNLNPDGAKVLMIRDSYACAPTPFFALDTSELHIVDMRNYKYLVGEKLKADEYIEEIKPDYVVVFYTGIYGLKASSGRFDFN